MLSASLAAPHCSSEYVATVLRAREDRRDGAAITALRFFGRLAPTAAFFGTRARVSRPRPFIMAAFRATFAKRRCSYVVVLIVLAVVVLIEMVTGQMMTREPGLSACVFICTLLICIHYYTSTSCTLYPTFVQGCAQEQL